MSERIVTAIEQAEMDMHDILRRCADLENSSAPPPPVDVEEAIWRLKRIQARWWHGRAA